MIRLRSVMVVVSRFRSTVVVSLMWMRLFTMAQRFSKLGNHMSNYSAILRKGEIFVKHWDKKTEGYVEEKKTEQVFSNILQFQITIEETSFGQFFEILAKEKDLYNKIFESAMYGFTMDSFVKECEQPAKECKDLDYVEVCWRSEYDDGELTTKPCFHGYGDWHLNGDPEKGGIAIEFTPLNEYKNCELRLDTNDKVLSMKSAEPLLKGTRSFMVYDVIWAILFEITWAGDVSKGRTLPWENTSASEAA